MLRLKNQQNINNKALSFKYNLVDFSLPVQRVTKKMREEFADVLKNYQVDGNLPSDYAGLDTMTLGDVLEDDISKKLRNLLKNTDEGKFSETIKLGGKYHVYFVKQKDLVESSIFTENKNRIRAMLFEKASKKFLGLWLEREKNKHYFRKFY